MRAFRRGDMDLEPSQDQEPRIERIRELVDALPEREQLAVSLLYFGAGSPTLDSVAEDMGVSVYKLKRYLSDGLEKLRTALQEEDGLGALLPDH